MRSCLSVILLGLIGWLAPLGSAGAMTLEELKVEPVALRNLPTLAFEPVGLSPGRPWVRSLATFQVPGQPTQWRHLMYYKKQSRTERVIWPVTLDLNTGQFKHHPPVPGLEVLHVRWLDGKLYLAHNIPGHLSVYDPAADTLTDLGMAFEKSSTMFRLVGGPDHTLALAGNHPAEVSLYDAATGAFKRFGQVSQVNAYCYELGQDRTHIYAATRGKGPWELLAIDKATGQRKLLAQRPTDGYINIGGQEVKMRQSSSDPFVSFTVAHGELREGKPEASNARPADKSKPPAPPDPQVLYETQTVYADGAVTLHYQDPADLSAWREAKLETPLGVESLLEAADLGDGRLAAAAGAYVPIVLLDPASGQSSLIPMERCSIRSIAMIDGQLWVTGYPSAGVYRLDLSRPVTSTEALPGRPALAEDDPAANPRLVARFPMTARTGGHIGLGLFPTSDGRIYLIARRHRHHRGFSIAWVQRQPDGKGNHPTGMLDTGSALDHLQVGGFNLGLDGRQLLVTTYIERNDQIEGSPPSAARLFVVDLEAGGIVAQWTPLADASCLTGIVQVEPDVAVGIALDHDKQTSTLYRINLKDGSILAARRYDRVIQGVPGVTSLPVKGASFILGPDGRIWTSIGIAAGRCAVVRIDPRTLAIDPVGLEPTNGSAMLFHEGRLYLTGQTQLRRVMLPTTP